MLADFHENLIDLRDVAEDRLTPTAVVCRFTLGRLAEGPNAGSVAFAFVPGDWTSGRAWRALQFRFRTVFDVGQTSDRHATSMPAPFLARPGPSESAGTLAAACDLGRAWRSSSILRGRALRSFATSAPPTASDA